MEIDPTMLNEAINKINRRIQNTANFSDLIMA